MTSTYTATLHMNRASQVVRIPKALAFEGVDTVEILKSGKDLILRPVEKKSREAWLKSLKEMQCPDFEPDRSPIIDPDRFLRLMESSEESER